ncbi:MAG: hypothetical protein JKX92_05410 [Porticoccaceae bacterium]|nr:hypothetical protein [Porticoccaceae bacterium]
MPLTLDTEEIINKTIDTLEINAFSIDLDRGEIHIGYDKGHMDAEAFIADVPDLLLTVDGPGFAAAIAAADGYANAMPAGSISVYGALKLALYDEISAATGLAGAVA